MVDALVCVVIISLMIAACMVSLSIARRNFVAMQQDRQARLTLQAVIETVPRIPGDYQGQRDGLRYKVVVTEEKARDARLCGFRAEITTRTVPGRTYALKATRWCDAAETTS